LGETINLAKDLKRSVTDNAAFPRLGSLGADSRNLGQRTQMTSMNAIEEEQGRETPRMFNENENDEETKKTDEMDVGSNRYMRPIPRETPRSYDSIHSKTSS
jgi:hypothetical protein